MPNTKLLHPRTVVPDVLAGLIVFFVALPLCIGIAAASGAPLFSGLISGAIGGIVVGYWSGSHTSISGPAAGLVAIFATQLTLLGSFEAFLVAVVLAGMIQLGLGLVKAGFFAAFVPSSVVKGLLAAVGLLLIFKQIPFLLGADSVTTGEMSFLPYEAFSLTDEWVRMGAGIHARVAAVGVIAMGVLLAADRMGLSKSWPVAPPLLVVLGGTAASIGARNLFDYHLVPDSHLLKIPVLSSWSQWGSVLTGPDFSHLLNPQVYVAAVTIALVVSAESLLNLVAVDRLDRKQRTSPPNRELLAQGIGNIAAGLLGGLPIATMIVRSSVGVQANSQTRLTAIVQGLALLIAVAIFPIWLNKIPLACLSAVLVLTGLKLASPRMLLQMWRSGRYQFIPFVTTILAIVLTDLLTGILLGLAISISFILHSNFRNPLRRVMERHLGGDLLHIELPNQVSFFKRASLENVLTEIPRGGHVLLDATHSVFIDPDVLDLIRDFRDEKAPARQVTVSLLGFRSGYQIDDRIQYVDYSSRELQEKATPLQVLQILKEGQSRFVNGQQLSRNFSRQTESASSVAHPLAVVLSCIDSRTPTEALFDLGVGDIYSVRVAGNIARNKVLGSLEYACQIAGAKLILVMGHTHCGAIRQAVEHLDSPESAARLTGCQHLDYILEDIQEPLEPHIYAQFSECDSAQQAELLKRAAIANVHKTVERILESSDTIAQLIAEDRVAIIGALYDVHTGKVSFLNETSAEVIAAAQTEPTPVLA